MGQSTDADAVSYKMHVLILAVYELSQPSIIDILGKPRYDHVTLPLFYTPFSGSPVGQCVNPPRSGDPQSNIYMDHQRNLSDGPDLLNSIIEALITHWGTVLVHP